MFTIITPKELNTKITSSMIVDKFCEKIMDEIIKTNNKGRRKCVFYVYGVYGNNKTGEISKKITPEVLQNPDYVYFRFDDYSDKVKKRFIDAGYRIEPTGYIGGVWQSTEDICW